MCDKEMRTTDNLANHRQTLDSQHRFHMEAEFQEIYFLVLSMPPYTFHALPEARIPWLKDMLKISSLPTAPGTWHKLHRC